MTPSTGARPAVALSALLGGALLMSACSAAQPSPGRTSGPSSPTATAAPATTPATSSPTAEAVGASTTCTPVQLRVTVDTSQSSGTAGSVYYPIDFANVSPRTCTLDGYPGVSFVTGPAGAQIGQAAARNTLVTPATVRLARGATAHATLVVAEAGNYTPSSCRPVTADWLRIYLPGQTAPAYTQFTTQVCAGTLPAGIGRQLQIYALEAGAGKAGATGP